MQNEKRIWVLREGRRCFKWKQRGQLSGYYNSPEPQQPMSKAKPRPPCPEPHRLWRVRAEVTFRGQLVQTPTGRMIELGHRGTKVIFPRLAKLVPELSFSPFLIWLFTCYDLSPTSQDLIKMEVLLLPTFYLHSNPFCKKKKKKFTNSPCFLKGFWVT